MGRQKSGQKKKSSYVKPHNGSVAAVDMESVRFMAAPPPLAVPKGMAIRAAILFASVFIVYFKTLYPSTAGGDSGEMIAVSHVLGVPHPPGYPLFSLLNKGWSMMIPFGTVAWRMNLLSAIFGSFAATCLYVAVALITGSCTSGWVAAALFAFSRLTWMYSVAAEVFALNNFFTGLLLLLFVQFLRQPSSTTQAILGAFCCGLSLTNQHTIVLYVVVIIPFVLWTGKRTLMTHSNLMYLGLAFAAGLSLYLYLPVSATLNQAMLTWGDQRDIPGILKHVLRQEYGTFSLAKGDQSATFLLATKVHLMAYANETMYVGPLLAFVGLLGLRESGFVGFVLKPIVGMVVLYIGFFNWRANLDLNNPLLAGVHERFWMQPNMIFCLLAGIGFDKVASKLRQRTAREAVAIMFAALMIGRNYSERDESNNWAVHNFGNALLTGLPENSILLMYGDLPGNAARYVQSCENVRPDIRVIDLEMMTMDWYVPMLAKFHKDVVYPGQVYRWLPDQINMKKFFDANYDKFDIFVFQNLNPDDTSWQDHYELWHYGLTYKVVKKNEAMNIAKYLEASQEAIPHFPVPDPVKYDKRTWEYVVREGYLAAGVNLALFFERRARTATSRQDNIELNKAAHKVYSDLLVNEADVAEPFWHKNFGIVCQNLVNAGETEYVGCMKEQWTTYVNSGADDPQIEAIQNILRGL